MTHTPGPWKVYGGTYLDGACLKVTAHNANRPFYALIGGNTRNEDAHRIASAAAMYEALKNLLGYPRMRVEDTGINITHAPLLVEYIKAAEQALAQAEGKVNIYDDTHRS